MYTFTTPAPVVTASAVRVTGTSINATTGDMQVIFEYLDANGNQIGGFQSHNIPAAYAAVVLAAGGGGATEALYAHLATRLNWAAGAAAADVAEAASTAFTTAMAAQTAQASSPAILTPKV